MPDVVAELFAGAGGMTEGLRLAAPELTAVGLEWDASACLTRAAAGHPTLRTDVARYPTAPFRRRGTRGVAGGPPCQTFSKAGEGEGRRHIESIKSAAGLVAGGLDPADALAKVADDALDYRTMLVLQPMRWARDLEPEFVVLEEVPAVLPVWEALAYHLHHRLGYHVWTGILDAECYGVPQTRDRAFLLAHADRPMSRPPATHRRYEKRLPHAGRYGDGVHGLFDDGLLPWVSMADALGWTDGSVALRTRRGAGLVERYGERPPRALAEPAFTITGADGGGSERLQWCYVNGNQEKAAVRPADHPAPTVHFGAAQNDVRCKPGEPRTWQVVRDGEFADEDAPPPWTTERPATTVIGSFAPDVAAAPGYRGVGDPPRQRADGSVRVSVTEAAVLQSFRPTYPWRGSRTRQYQQIGNAVPPLLARAVFAHVLGVGVTDPLR